MPVTSAVASAVSTGTASGDRLELTIAVTEDTGAKHQFLLHTSYRKHIVDTYKTDGGYVPAYSSENTITSLSFAHFTAAFKEYGDAIAARILSQGIALVPKDPANVISTSYHIHFGSDAQSLGNSVHCFPCVPAGQTSTKAVVLDSEGLKGLVKVCKFLFHTPGFASGTPEAILAAQTTKPTGKPDPSQLAVIQSVSKTSKTWAGNRSQAKSVYDVTANQLWLAALLGASDYSALVAKLAHDKPTIT